MIQENEESPTGFLQVLKERERLLKDLHEERGKENNLNENNLFYIYYNIMKVRPSAKKICQNCKIVLRRFQ